MAAEYHGNDHWSGWLEHEFESEELVLAQICQRVHQYRSRLLGLIDLKVMIISGSSPRELTFIKWCQNKYFTDFGLIQILGWVFHISEPDKGYLFPVYSLQIMEETLFLS